MRYCRVTTRACGEGRAIDGCSPRFSQRRLSRKVRQLRADARSLTRSGRNDTYATKQMRAVLRAADAMTHTQQSAASAHSRRRALKRRRSSMHEASGFFAVTSDSSDFSVAVPAAAICASCKPTLLCSDGSGAAATYGSSLRPTALAPNRLILPIMGPAIPVKRERLLVCGCMHDCL